MTGLNTPIRRQVSLAASTVTSRPASPGPPGTPGFDMMVTGALFCLACISSSLN